MALFRNHYRCYRCESEWDDIWSAACDDDCPSCGARHVSPTFSEDERTDVGDPSKHGSQFIGAITTTTLATHRDNGCANLVDHALNAHPPQEQVLGADHDRHADQFRIRLYL